MSVEHHPRTSSGPLVHPLAPGQARKPEDSPLRDRLQALDLFSDETRNLIVNAELNKNGTKLDPSVIPIKFFVEYARSNDAELKAVNFFTLERQVKENFEIYDKADKQKKLEELDLKLIKIDQEIQSAANDPAEFKNLIDKKLKLLKKREPLLKAKRKELRTLREQLSAKLASPHKNGSEDKLKQVKQDDDRTEDEYKAVLASIKECEALLK